MKPPGKEKTTLFNKAFTRPRVPAIPTRPSKRAHAMRQHPSLSVLHILEIPNPCQKPMFLIAVFAAQALATDVLPDQSAMRSVENLHLGGKQGSFHCPADRSMTPPRVHMETGILARLPGSDTPDGEGIAHKDNMDIEACLSLCSKTSDCQGVIWICKEHTEGTCLLYKDVTGLAPWDCPTCVGYRLTQQCGISIDEIPQTISTSNGALTKLSGNQLPIGTVLETIPGVGLNRCLNMCSEEELCRGAEWECSDAHSGSCKLYSRVSEIGIGNCLNCMGYTLKAQCPPSGTVPSVIRAASVGRFQFIFYQRVESDRVLSLGVSCASGRQRRSQRKAPHELATHVASGLFVFLRPQFWLQGTSMVFNFSAHVTLLCRG